MFSVKTLDSFQVIPIPVSKENLSAVYKLKKKKVEFSLFYITHTYRCRSPKFMLNLLYNTARKYKWLQQLGCIQFDRRSNCIPPMHSYLIVAKSLPSWPPFFA